jgi:hypothetical protein
MPARSDCRSERGRIVLMARRPTDEAANSFFDFFDFVGGSSGGTDVFGGLGEGFVDLFKGFGFFFKINIY